MHSITARQQQILDFIAHWLTEHSCPPTRAEIATHFGFRSPNAAEDHLRALSRKGLIELIGGTSRGIRLTNGSTPSESALTLPVIGRVAAGVPILAETHIEEQCPVAPGLFRPHADFLLRVEGLSMRDAGILDGDLLAVKSQREARENQIVVARIDDEVTVKRFQRGDAPHLARLLPDNPDFSPIEVDMRRHEFVIEGCYVGIIRR